MHVPTPSRHRAVAANVRPVSRRSRVTWGIVAAAAVWLTTASVGSVVHPGLSATLASSRVAPVSIYAAGYVPGRVERGDHASVELGVRFHVAEAGTITGLRFYKPSAGAWGSTATLWNGDGTRLASARFSHTQTTVGWQAAQFSAPVAISPGTTYVASFHSPRGRYAEQVNEFAGGRTVGNAIIRASAGLYAYGSATVFPTASWRGTGYGIDVVFAPGSSGPAPKPSGTGTPTHPAPTSASASKPTPITSAPSSSSSPARPSSSSSKPTPSTSAPSSSASKPTPSTSAPSSSSSAPPPSSSTSGYPDASNTGVPAGTSLQAVPGAVRSGPGWSWDNRGWVSVTGANAVFAGFKVSGTVEVYAKGAVIRDNDIETDGNTWAIGLRPSASDVTVSHNTLHGPCTLCANRLTYGIFGDLGGDAGSVIDANNLYDIDHPLQQERGLVENNYVHGLAATPAGTDHVDAFFSGGGTTDQLTVRHNTLLNDYLGTGSTASIMLNNAFGEQSNRLIEDNYIAGGGFTLYGGLPADKVSGHNTIIRDNKFSTRYYPKSGYYGAVVYLQNGPTDSFTDNTWADGPNAGKVINP